MPGVGSLRMVTANLAGRAVATLGKTKQLTSAPVHTGTQLARGTLGKTKQLTSAPAYTGHPSAQATLGKRKGLTSAPSVIHIITAPGTLGKQKQLASAPAKINVYTAPGTLGKTKDLTSAPTPIHVFTAPGTLGKQKGVVVTAAYTPGGPALAHLLAWYSAAKCWQNIGATVPAVANGDPVASITDLSGVTGLAVQSAAGCSLSTPVIGGRPVISPPNSPTAGQMQLPATVACGRVFTVYCVGQFTGAGVLGAEWIPFANGGANGRVELANLLAAVTARYASNAGSIATGAAATGSVSIVARWRSDSAFNVYFSATGVPEFMLIPAAAATGPLDFNFLFSDSVVGSQGNFAEMLAYNDDEVASGGDVRTRSYLQSQYGLTLP